MKGRLSDMTYSIGTDMSPAQRVAKIDLTKVMAHVAEDTGMEGEALVRAEQLYRGFLILKATKPEARLVPPTIVDEVWHAHITFTRQYMGDCELVFGEYLHHEKVDAEEGDNADYKAHHALFEKTQAMFRDVLGIDMYSQLTERERRISMCAGGTD